MPYTCSAYGGRVDAHALARRGLPHLRPARGAAVYGVLARSTPTPAAPGCCTASISTAAATRVDWLSVVEAASEQTTGRAWVENGRLRMRMNQYWSRDGGGQDDDPCPRWRRHGPYGDDCAGRGGSRRRGSVVEMPPGFAPAFGLPIRFVGSDLPPMPADPRGGPEASAKGGPAWSARVEPPRDMPTRDMPGREPSAKEPFAKEPFAKDPPAKSPQVAGATTTAPGTPTGTPKPAVRPATPADVLPTRARASLSRPSPSRRSRTARGGSRRPRHIVRSAGTGSIVPRIINRPAAEQTSPGNGMVSKPTTPYVEKVPEPVPVRVAEAKPTIEPAATSKPIITSSAKPTTVSEAAPGHSTFTALTPSATTQALVGFAGLVAVALGLFAWTRHREQLSLAAAGGREFGSVNFATGDAKVERVVARLRAAPPATLPGQRHRRRRRRPRLRLRQTYRSRARAMRHARCWARAPMPARRPSRRLSKACARAGIPTSLPARRTASCASSARRRSTLRGRFCPASASLPEHCTRNVRQSNFFGTQIPTCRVVEAFPRRLRYSLHVARYCAPHPFSKSQPHSVTVDKQRAAFASPESSD